MAIAHKRSSTPSLREDWLTRLMAISLSEGFGNRPNARWYSKLTRYWLETGASAKIKAARSSRFAKVAPLVSSTACRVVADDEREVTTCSRLGRPSAVA